MAGKVQRGHNIVVGHFDRWMGNNLVPGVPTKQGGNANGKGWKF